MKSLISSTFILLTVLALTGCGKVNATQTSVVLHPTPEPTGDGLKKVNASPASLIGTWKSGCTSDVKAGAWFINTITFQDQTLMTTDRKKYSDATCNDEIFDEYRVSKYTIAAPSAGKGTGSPQITESIVTVQFDIMFAGDVVLYNQGKYCGLSDWAVNDPQTILGENLGKCANYVTSPTFNSNLYGDGTKSLLYLDDCTDSTDTNCTAFKYTLAPLTE